MYAYIENETIINIIQDIDPVFPNTPVEKRFAPEFLSKCQHFPDDALIKTGMVLQADGSWDYPKNAFEPMPEELDGAKKYKIDQSKTELANWLENNPMLYSDGKYYSVTEEKQSLLNSNLASYERATNAGIDYPLKWNSTGEECVSWEYAELLKLSLTIAGYVAPKVSMQQSFEIQIRNCSSMDELNGIVISYD